MIREEIVASEANPGIHGEYRTVPVLRDTCHLKEKSQCWLRAYTPSCEQQPVQHADREPKLGEPCVFCYDQQWSCLGLLLSDNPPDREVPPLGMQLIRNLQPTSHSLTLFMMPRL